MKYLSILVMALFVLNMVPNAFAKSKGCPNGMSKQSDPVGNGYHCVAKKKKH